MKRLIIIMLLIAGTNAISAQKAKEAEFKKEQIKYGKDTIFLPNAS